MEIPFVYGIKALLLPPGGVLLLAALLLVLALYRGRGASAEGDRARGARVLIFLALCLVLAVVAISLPVTARWLAGGLEQRHPPIAPDEVLPRGRQAIVVLGVGLDHGAPEYGRPSPTGTLLVRLRYGAHLALQTGLPVLVSGGRVFDVGESEASVMRDVLEHEYHVPVKWLEEQSRNTAGNARESARILKAEGITQVFLVTHATHMPRAMRCFEREGMEPTAAPTAFVTPPGFRPGLLEWIPSHGALSVSAAALHEYLGMLWYELRY